MNTKCLNKRLFLIGILAILATPFAFTFKALAGDPIQEKCVNDAQTLAFRTGGTYRYGFGNERTLTVKLILSKNCHANWVTADVPSGSYLYLKDAQGGQFVKYQAKVNGWNYTDTSNYYISYKACVQPPDRQEVCTDLIK